MCDGLAEGCGVWETAVEGSSAYVLTPDRGEREERREGVSQCRGQPVHMCTSNGTQLGEGCDLGVAGQEGDA